MGRVEVFNFKQYAGKQTCTRFTEKSERKPNEIKVFWILATRGRLENKEYDQVNYH